MIEKYERLKTILNNMIFKESSIPVLYPPYSLSTFVDGLVGSFGGVTRMFSHHVSFLSFYECSSSFY